jgi:hypothetical protein
MLYSSIAFFDRRRLIQRVDNSNECRGSAANSTNAPAIFLLTRLLGFFTSLWPAAGSADTELGVMMEPEVCHGKLSSSCAS